jgi:hypothetical protein
MKRSNSNSKSETYLVQSPSERLMNPNKLISSNKDQKERHFPLIFIATFLICICLFPITESNSLILSTKLQKQKFVQNFQCIKGEKTFYETKGLNDLVFKTISLLRFKKVQKKFICS